MPLGSFSKLQYQSPIEVLALFLLPNQPSSRTSSSMPNFLAEAAISRIVSSLKLKYAASQVLISTGLG